jgi:uncharacterized membrane protein
VREQITFDFAGSFSGAYRDIPMRTGESITKVSVSEGATVYRPGANTELGGFGLPDSFGVTDIDGGLRIVWHYGATDERRTFTISYRFRGLAVAYDDVVDVNLRVWGEHWPVGVANLTAVMKLPRPTRLSPSYRVWGSPAWVRGVVARLPDRATLQAVEVPAHQFVEHRVVFPRNLLTSTRGAQVRPGNALGKIVAEELVSQREFQRDQEQIDDAKEHPGRTLLLLLVLGLGPALGLMWLVWLFYGRERRTGYDREYEQSPPTDTEPALIPSLVKQETVPGSNEFTATLFDLIRRGRYKATPVTTERSVWGGLRHQDVADLLVAPGDETVETAPFEGPVTRVVDSIVDADGERLSEFREEIESAREANSKRFKSFKEQVTTAIEERGWYVSKGLVVIGAGFGVFALTAVVLLWMGIDGWRAASPRWSDVVLVALGGCAVANAVALLIAASQLPLWRRRTNAGQTEAERWESFRRYLTDFPRLKEAPPATLELWERYLVYGIAFGIAERVLQGAHLHMPEALHEQSSIYWISPNGDLGSGPTALGIGDLSSGFGSALAPPGSSGGGGGFSGGGSGGGGGGGGGAW